MKKFIAFLILNLLKSLFNILSKLNNKEGVLLEKIINEANFSIGKGFGGINTQDKEIYQVVKFLDRTRKNLIIDV